MIPRLLICFALLSCSNNFTPPPKVVEVEVVKKSRFLLTTRLIGFIKAKNETILTAKVSGSVNFKAHPGDSLRKGSVIAEIESNDLQQSLDLSNQAFAIAQKKYERAMTLSKSRTLSAQDLGERQTEMIAAQRDYHSAKRQLEQSQLIAPFDGTVGVFQAREGAHMNTGDPLVAFYQPNALVVTFDIPEDLVPRIKKGQKVIVKDKEFHIDGYQSVIDPETHMALASFDYTCEKCVIGANIDVELALVDKEKAISVPMEALFYKDTIPFVYVIKEGKAMPQKITLGERAEGRFEVIEGLSEDDQVISKNISRLWPTADVMVKEEKAEPKDPKVEKNPEKTEATEKKA